MALSLLDSFVSVPNGIAQPLNTGPLKNALTTIEETLSERTTIIPDLRISERRIREGDNIKSGEHPGLHIEMHYPDKTRVSINFYGGIRMPDEIDVHDTRQSSAFHHATRTIMALDKNTAIGVDFYDANGQRTTNSWLSLSPSLSNTPTIMLTNLQHTDGDVELNIQSPKEYPGSAKHLVDEMRTYMTSLINKYIAYSPDSTY